MSYSKAYIDRAEQVILHTYNRFQIVLEKGKGVRLYDVDGKEYLDFAAGIAVFALGYNHPEYSRALKEQIDKVIHTSNLYYNVPMLEAAEKLTKASGLSKVFFTNSGTEAVEGAIKAARKYAYLKDGCTDHEIIAMNHSFHGRSLGALSVTGNTHYQEPFKPLIGGIKFADFNDLESVKAQITGKTCAIILETVQGEGGIYPADPDFLAGIRKLCDEHDILLILDEIQCGMGRTGSMFAYQDYGILPDIMTCAKALGCGVPVGAFVLNEKTANASLVPGDHGTTYGGNPFACAAVSKVFELFETEQIVEHVRRITPYLEEKLDALVKKYDFITKRRGKGLMQGLVLEGKPVGEVVTKAIENGLLVISAGSNVLRLVPPLVITEADVDEMIEKLEKSFKKICGIAGKKIAHTNAEVNNQRESKKEVCVMPALRCAAVKCVYNKENLCSRGDIQVCGEEARTVDETCCSSFQERSGESNAMESGCGCDTIRVGCTACDCTFNKEKYCQAGAIDIDGSRACNSQETCCGTFRCKE